MNKKYIIVTGFLTILFTIAFVTWKVTKQSQTQSQTSSVAHRVPLPKEMIIMLTKNGFSPNQVNIKIGTDVRWKNESGSEQTVNSDNYPTNQIHRELNFGVFNNGSTVVHTFTKVGVYGYHNQFHHTQEGKIIVVE